VLSQFWCCGTRVARQQPCFRRVVINCIDIKHAPLVQDGHLAVLGPVTF
jgi:hypothetical protein